uniref:receptor protein-tyrosine kinase n=1 Tax=Acrobeloides nanus TaxID=290746 RepID=A0A914DG32_9BILA
MNYALVIYQNPDLRNVGLGKLTAIKNGGVRITENTKLCYSRYINWEKLLLSHDALRDLIVDQDPRSCNDECRVKNENKCEYNGGILSCWNATTCQIACPHQKYSNHTAGPGCDENGEMCHPQCVGGCFRPNDPGACHSCRNVQLNGTCNSSCPEGFYEQMGRRCYTKDECRNLFPVPSSTDSFQKSYWKPFRNQCIYECPVDYEEDPKDRHSCIECKEKRCPKKCSGGSVESVTAALKYKNCNIIIGNLEVEIRTGKTGPVLTEAFGAIEEITGYLLVRFTQSLVSLHMFKNLSTIRGESLYHNTYALVVFENANLKQLFNIERQPLHIMHGKVSLQNNGLLCYHRVEAFLNHVNLSSEITDNDVSKYSNGDKAICNEIPLEVGLVDYNSNSFVLRWTPFVTIDMDHRKFLGYQVFYKKIDDKDLDKIDQMTIDDDRSVCSDTWKMQFESVDPDPENQEGEENNSGALIVNLDSDTTYAYYVQTRTVNHAGARNAISKIGFVRTLFGVPDSPRLKKAEVADPFTINLEWDNPPNPRGVITHYMIIWIRMDDSAATNIDDVCNYSQRRRASSSLMKSESAGLTSMANNNKDTCPRDQGCCKCADSAATKPEAPEISEREIEEGDRFENTIQNTVFVQQKPAKKQPRTWTDKKTYVGDSNLRYRRSIEAEAGNFTDEELSKLENDGKDELAMKETDTFTGIYNSSHYTVTNQSAGKINVSRLDLSITGFPHFTEYQVLIYACQDVNAKNNACSQRPAWILIRTAARPENDRVDPEKVEVIDDFELFDSKLNNTRKNKQYSERRFYWAPPTDPNGIVLGYRIKLIDLHTAVPAKIEHCKSVKDFEEHGGFIIGLPDGVYTLEIRTITLAGDSPATVLKDHVTIHTPGFFTLEVILAMVISFLLIATIGGLVIYYFASRYFGKKVREYVRQTISANPEYLSQLDVYQTDEWELRREDLELDVEIGRGTFGKVLRGFGKNVKSMSGIVFGECAVKTVPETASSAERLHFLIEASVMKQFNTSYIVRLYGVVSDGQPVLVVMEMMEKGNLRDFLRSHRPGAEENVDNNPVPTATQYFTWAAQIADGMAYLESLKFCHRDLAARNCMVHADETVKIGDFGMARDIYYHEYYKPAGKRLMPVRWMAPESLKDGKFTMKSDVWSYGVVLYEMLTLGQQPYAGLGNDQVFNYIGVQRRVLLRPTDCPDFWFVRMNIF